MNVRKGIPFCNYCSHGELEIDDVIDSYNLSDSTSDYIEKVVGHCPYCNRQYIWKNVFSYIGYNNLEEDEDCEED